MDIDLSVKKARRLMLWIWAIVVFAGFIAEFFQQVLEVSDGFLIRLLCLKYECNLPTWFISAVQLLCALQLTMIAFVKRKMQAPYAWHWTFLAIIFYYISVDELVRIHEYGSDWFHETGVFYYGWVIPAGIIVLVLGACYAGFLWHLPRRSRFQFILAATIFVGGAVGVEMILGYWASMAGESNIMWSMIAFVEEAMEILGMTLFFIALAEYVSRESVRISIQWGQNETPGDLATRAS